MATNDDEPGTSDHAIALPDNDVPAAGRVRAVGPWAVGRSQGEVFAVSRRCRHQLADLSEGSVDAEGCLVCPWHQSRYDVRTGAMVSGPKGFLGYHGRTPGYTQFVLAYGRHLKLRVATVARTAAGYLLR
jgi:nitrite reductase/ring-hydroxylating ferredoxin subunit